MVVKNALREFANWNDVWDGDYGYGGGGYGMRGGCKLTGERGCVGCGYRSLASAGLMVEH